MLNSERQNYNGMKNTMGSEKNQGKGRKKERPEEDVQRLERKDNSIYFLSAEKH